MDKRGGASLAAIFLVVTILTFAAGLVAEPLLGPLRTEGMHGRGSSETRLAKLPAEDVRTAEMALVVLNKMRSATIVGMNFSEYSSRVLDAKIEFDLILTHINTKTFEATQLRHLLDRSMDKYIEAKQHWANSIQQLKEADRVAGLWEEALASAQEASLLLSQLKP